ncbi:hypothetical protein L7F22_038538 [Adiantum nelumboides]|nr:hypothetical protein [Adiantum nelumboides]
MAPVPPTNAPTAHRGQGNQDQQELLNRINHQLENLSVHLVRRRRGPPPNQEQARGPRRQAQEYHCYNCSENGHGMYYCPYPRRIGNFRGPRNQVSPPRERQQQQPPFPIQQAPPVQILRPPVQPQPQQPPPSPPPPIAPIPPLPIPENRVVNVISLDDKVKVEEEEKGKSLPKDKGKAKVEDVDAMPIKRARQEEVAMSETEKEGSQRRMGRAVARRSQSRGERSLSKILHLVMATGDLEGNLERFRVQLRIIGYPHPLDLKGSVKGSTVTWSDKLVKPTEPERQERPYCRPSFALFLAKGSTEKGADLQPCSLAGARSKLATERASDRQHVCGGLVIAMPAVPSFFSPSTEGETQKGVQQQLCIYLNFGGVLVQEMDPSHRKFVVVSMDCCLQVQEFDRQGRSDALQTQKIDSKRTFLLPTGAAYFFVDGAGSKEVAGGGAKGLKEVANYQKLERHSLCAELKFDEHVAVSSMANCSSRFRGGNMTPSLDVGDRSLDLMKAPVVALATEDIFAAYSRADWRATEAKEEEEEEEKE